MQLTVTAIIPYHITVTIVIVTYDITLSSFTKSKIKNKIKWLEKNQSRKKETLNNRREIEKKQVHYPQVWQMVSLLGKIWFLTLLLTRKFMSKSNLLLYYDSGSQDNQDIWLLKPEFLAIWTLKDVAVKDKE